MFQHPVNPSSPSLNPTTSGRRRRQRQQPQRLRRQDSSGEPEPSQVSPPPPPSDSSSPGVDTPGSMSDNPPSNPPDSSSSDPPPPSSSSDSPPPPSSSTMATISVTITVPPISPSSTNSGMRGTESESVSTPPPSESPSQPSTSGPPSSTSLTSDGPGTPDDVPSTTSSSSAPPSGSSSSSAGPTDSGGSSGGSSSSSSPSPSSPNRPSQSESSSPSDSSSGGPAPPQERPTSMGNEAGPEPTTTWSTAVTFTTTDANGSTVLTVPSQFTTVIVTTLPGGTFTTVTEVVANPPGILNPGGGGIENSTFFQNKGAVAGVFIAALLALVAMVVFVVFAIRRRRSRTRNERDAEIAAGLQAAVSNQRFADDEDHPVVMRNVPSALRGRSPWPDDDDDDRLVYGSSAAPIMYSNFHGVGPPSQNMIIAPEAAYPATPVRYALARRDSGSPSPERDLPGLPRTTFEPASPTGNSGGWSSSHHPNGSGGGGAALASRRSHSVSPIPSIPSNSALGSAYHGTREHGGTSAGHAPPSSFSHRPPGKDGSGSVGGTATASGSGSGGTSAPSLMTAGARGTQRVSSPTLGDMYPPEYEHYSRPASSAHAHLGEPQIGYAYEPEPVLHNHQIVSDLAEVQGAYDGMRSPFSADIANMSVGSRSMYSREDDESDEGGHAMDSRLDPLMRMRGGIASAASVGPRDHEDYMRRVVPQLQSNSSNASHSHSMVQSHSTH